MTGKTGSVHRAVVLARGAGTRMRALDADASLSDEQRRAATLGHKALMPIGERPFLDFVLQALADAGISHVGLVVAPDHDAMRAAYPADRGPGGVQLSWLIQAEATGTAQAVLVARAWVGDDAFLVMNGDNLYPVPALNALIGLDAPGLAGFDRASLVATSNIPAERLAAFALLDVDPHDRLCRIVEKPSMDEIDRAGQHALISMNLWRCDARIFDACRNVAPSSRGEYELPSAVMRAVASGVSFTVVPALGPVLDLSSRADVAEVTRRLRAGVASK